MLEIALMCPFEQGRAVYGARVLLTYVDLPFADYRNDCEQPGYTGGGKSRPGAQSTSQKNQALAPKPEKPMVEVFPNPNNGTFTVVLPNAKPARIELINAMGQVLHSANLKGRETLTPHLAPGLYLCRVWQDNHVVHQSKLILQP